MSSHPAVELLSSYLDREVTRAELRLVEDHLESCGTCRRALAGLSAVSEGVRRLEAVAPPPTLSAEVERRVRLASRETSLSSRLESGVKRWLAQPVLAPVFAIILALGAILYLFAFGLSETERRGTRFVIAAAPSAEAELESEDAPAADEPTAPPARGFEAGPRGALERAELGDAARKGSERWREVAGRRFAAIGGVWVESGLEDREADEVLEWHGDAEGQRPEWAAFEELGRVRIEVENRVVEVVYPGRVAPE